MSIWQNLLGVAALVGLVAAWLAVVVAAIGVVCWLEGRGKLRAKRRGGAATAAGVAVLAVQQLLQPPARHVIRAKQELSEKVNREESGGSDGAGDETGP
jgi:hypothetical protein